MLQELCDDAILCVGQDTKSDFMFKMLGRQIQWELTNTKIIEKLDTLIEEWLTKWMQSQCLGL